MKLKNIRSFFKDESGQTTTEYILILAVVVMVIMKMRGALKDNLLNAVNKVGGNINSVVDDMNSN